MATQERTVITFSNNKSTGRVKDKSPAPVQITAEQILRGIAQNTIDTHSNLNQQATSTPHTFAAGSSPSKGFYGAAGITRGRNNSTQPKTFVAQKRELGLPVTFGKQPARRPHYKKHPDDDDSDDSDEPATSKASPTRSVLGIKPAIAKSWQGQNELRQLLASQKKKSTNGLSTWFK
eukprot:TRINITY_DN6660_c0_g1_i1.p1 TRINITY_DN6660_c0_g1~~TRINITY_DN6660_c0_g1_i1.p1  ORF type:complete len:185 (-),score=47.22 TRINITY_DN6660_c0_g1_i1:3-533(-)